MVCPRCVSTVKHIFKRLGVEPIFVKLGTVKLTEEIPEPKLDDLDKHLQQSGFVRIDDKKGKLLEKAKTLIIQTIHHSEEFDLSVNWSSYLAEEINVEYNYLSGLFSSTEGITLEQFIIRQKMEKVKEFLIYDELSIKEMSYKLGYSSPAHLSGQFKKIIGLTPSAFKKTIESHLTRKSLDDII